MQKQIDIITLFPEHSEEVTEYISPEGRKLLNQHLDPKDPSKNQSWSTDYKLEMPVLVQKNGEGSFQPTTLIQVFIEVVQKYPQFQALSYKENNKWKSLTYQQYFEQSKYFGQALIKLGITKQKSVNIIGYNSPEWVIAFMGSILGFYLPVGIYTTNQSEACKYVAEHSEAEVIVAENKSHLIKYLPFWSQLPTLKYIILYADVVPTDLPSQFKGQVLLWKDVIELGKTYKPLEKSNDINYVLTLPKPGNCCTLVYTSGTTGPPKAVMLSHDNYTWTAKSCLQKFDLKPNAQQQERIISYLPLSHVAGQSIDIILALMSAANVYFADSTALAGSLINYLTDVRPTFFMSVPRVWEKIEEKMKLIASQNSGLKTKIATWAKSLGAEGTFNEQNQKPNGFQFSLAKSLIFNKIKKGLGLDQAKYLVFGAAPLSTAIRGYFLSLNMCLINTYGMSESTGPQTISYPDQYDKFDEGFLKSAGGPILGTQIMIYQPDKDGNGEICYRGRNRFMGYFKNEEATRQTIDQNGFLHSGDVGKLDKRGNLQITGRIKELIITAGGENVAPVLIEEILKEELKFISNALVVGEGKKFLAVILTLKHDLDKEGKLKPDTLSPEVIPILQTLGVNDKTISEATKNPKLISLIEQGLKKTNERVISKAQQVIKWKIIDGDFTEAAGDLTPTLKLKRSVVNKKYQGVIDQFYIEPKI